MRSIAIERAEGHLDRAREAFQTLSLEHGRKAYAQSWSDFLTQASRFYSKLEQGAKGCGKSEDWFARRKGERRKDALLSYLHHARNSDEHGLDYVVAETGSSVSGTLNPSAGSFKIEAQVMLDENGKVHMRNARTETPDAITSIVLHDPRMELVTVYDHRYGDKFDPPKTHLGKEIDPYDPNATASLMLDYLDEMLTDASSLPQH